MTENARLVGPAGFELEAFCGRDPERSRRGEPTAEIPSAARDLPSPQFNGRLVGPVGFEPTTNRFPLNS